MSNIEEAKAAKGRGNAAFSKGDYETAIKEFSAAIELNPADHVFYSNRSGAYASMKKFEEALTDAEKCISIKPEWAKGYGRKGFAAYGLKDFEKADAAYKEGLKIDPNNATCKQGATDCEAALKTSSNPMGALFGEGMWAKLQADPNTREMLKDPSFVQKMKMMQSNPNAFGNMASDPQMSAALGVLLGIGSAGFKTMNPEDMKDADGDTPMKESTPTPAPKQEEEVEEVDLELEKEKKQRADAMAEKTKGNGFYKKKQFKEALECYEKAIELDPENLTFYLNKSAVYYESKEYEKCIEVAEQVIKDSKDSKCYDYTVVAKAYNRVGAALEKKGDLKAAMEAQKSALLESPLPAAQNAMKRLKRKADAAEKAAYLDDDKAEEHKQKGNDCFKQQKWTDAIEEYTESLKRKPNNHKVYSNRAACYTKLMDWQRGLDDCEKCLSIDASFIKAYIRKAKIQHFLKQYHKALETYQKGLDLEPENKELAAGKRQTMYAINQENSSGNVDPSRAQEAMKDPEIRQILSDPTISKVLQDMQTDPALGQRAMQDPVIMSKIEKLIAAGVLQVGSK